MGDDHAEREKHDATQKRRGWMRQARKQSRDERDTPLPAFLAVGHLHMQRNIHVRNDSDRTTSRELSPTHRLRPDNIELGTPDLTSSRKDGRGRASATRFPDEPKSRRHVEHDGSGRKDAVRRDGRRVDPHESTSQRCDCL
ncbi:hypothetical protein K3495_g10397 [Podosphaera aphanis]|nr:hypothetical protein K3495_g10397 [Podosphaera aphanis]